MEVEEGLASPGELQVVLLPSIVEDGLVVDVDPAETEYGPRNALLPETGFVVHPIQALLHQFYPQVQQLLKIQALSCILLDCLHGVVLSFDVLKFLLLGDYQVVQEGNNCSDALSKS